MEIDENQTRFHELIKKHPEWQMEKTIDSVEFSQWLADNLNICMTCCLLYVIAVFFGKKYMENKPRYNLRQPMLIWSIILSVFSIIGAVRTTIISYTLYQSGGMKAVICSDLFYLAPIARFWGPVFVASKILEYMDTMFIILRKQKLIFLHWYHHLTVSLFSWFTYGFMYAGGGVFMTVNFIVHAMMYSYYALKAAGVKIPRPVAILITSSQIVQMIIGCHTVYYIYSWQDDVNSCPSSRDYIFYSAFMYFSYFILFCQFFYSAYITPRVSPPKQKVDNIDKKDHSLSAPSGKVHNNNNDITGLSLRERKTQQVR